MRSAINFSNFVELVGRPPSVSGGGNGYSGYTCGVYPLFTLALLHLGSISIIIIISG